MNINEGNIAIALPTFNESKNLRILLNKIHKIVPGALIVIVDDSNDKEKAKIKRIAAPYQNITLITRQKKLGRGSAILTGFTEALKNKTIQYFVEMDTDLAHDPEEIPFFLTTMKTKKAHLVVGSRYLPKSKIIAWPLKRLVLSKLINKFLNLWLKVSLHDYTNGYRLYQRKAVEYLIKTGLQERNFIALSESAFLLHKKGFKIIEIPTTFTDRKRGESSVGIKELFMCLIGAFRIKLRYNKRDEYSSKY